ncbi:MAG: alpha/beta fold hydrolase [Candidatus Rokuibacteriota bacterium]
MPDIDEQRESELMSKDANYVMLGDANTWYAAYGAGRPLVLLHPGGVGVDSRAFGSLLDTLSSRFRVYTPDRRAHGCTADTDGPFTYEMMADDTAAFLKTVVGDSAHVLGYSDGAVVALLTALRHRELVDHLVLVAGVFHRDGWLPGVLASDEKEPPEFLVASYAEVSPDGRDHAAVVARKLAQLHAHGPTLTADDLGRVKARTLVMVADDDEVALEHAVAMYRGISNAELAVVPGCSHGLLVEKPEMCSKGIVAFLTRDPIATIAPIRRAPGETSAP